MKKGIFRRAAVILMTAAVMMSGAGALPAAAFNFTPITGINEDKKPDILKLRSESVYMINMDNDEVLVDIESDKQRVPASLTKIMTAIVLLDEFGGDEQLMSQTRYSAGSEAFDELYGTGASTADIQPNESVTCVDLLYALMLPSACEAANVIAVGMCGSVDAFCDRMNAKAEELGMTDSHFSNAHGLSGDNNYSTCRDIAKMCKYAIDTYPLFKKVVGTYDYTLSPTNFHPDGTYIYSTNFMLSPSPENKYYYSYCRGIKTGTLDVAGRCFASYAENDGVRYLTVTMGAPMYKLDEDYEKGYENPSSVYSDDVIYYNLVDHINLYEWAFTYLEDTELVDKNSELKEAKVEFGESRRDYVTLKPERGMSISYPSYQSKKDITKSITVYDNIVAPVYKGDRLGELTLMYKGEVIAKIPLVATETVNRSKIAEKKAIAKAFPSSTEFKVALLIIFLFALAVFIVHVMIVQSKYRKRD